MRVWVKPKRCPNCGGRLYRIATCYLGANFKWKELNIKRRILITVYFECECQYCGWKGLVFPNKRGY